MKKVISLFLALIMVFSLTTVAFAAETEAGDQTQTEETVDPDTTDPETTDPEAEGDVDLGFVGDIPMALVPFLAKIAFIAIPIVTKFVTIAAKLGLIDLDPQVLIDAFIDLIQGEEATPDTDTDTDTEVEPEVDPDAPVVTPDEPLAA